MVLAIFLLIIAHANKKCKFINWIYNNLVQDFLEISAKDFTVTNYEITGGRGKDSFPLPGGVQVSFFSTLIHSYGESFLYIFEIKNFIHIRTIFSLIPSQKKSEKQ